MVAGVLGVLASGRAYVPIDPTHPEDRSAFVLRDSGARTLLCDDEHADQAARIADGLARARIEQAPAGRTPRRRPRPGDLSYCLYTSGSTGRPKGVQQQHRNVVRLLDGYSKRLALTGADVVTLLSTFAFDAAVVDVFSTLLAGATLCTYELRARGLGELPSLLADRGVTVYHSTPTVWRELVAAEPALPSSIRAVVLGGEEVVGEDIAMLRSACGAATVLVNGYGMTECSWALLHVVGPDEVLERRTVALGAAIDGVSVQLDTPFGPQRVPYGTGTIRIASPYVALGYHDRPDETASAFPAPHTYVTTDFGRLLPGGEIEFAGRHAHQVKLRGFRIDLREVEAVLAASPGVDKAAAAVHDGPRGPELVGYIVGGTPGDVREHVATLLPEYMVPSVIVALAAMPTGATGKLDRKALPAPDASAFAGTDTVAPRDPTEQALADLWCELLGLDSVGVHDDFFDLGGHSLLAIRVLAHIKRLFELDLSVRVFFETPTIEGLAREIVAHQAKASAPAIPPLVPAARSEHPPLSYAQARLWFLHQLEPESGAYVLAYNRRFENLDIEALRRALEVVVHRHEVLRTSFPAVDGEPYQRVHPAVRWELPVVGVTELARVQDELQRPFDLAAAPPLRACAVQTGPTSYVLFVTIHHIITDGGSFEIFSRELWSCYDAFVASAAAPSLPPLPVQYVDYAAWQRRWLSGAELERQLAFWTQTLAGAPDEVSLPLKGPRPSHRNFVGRTHTITVGPRETAALTAFAQRHGATLFMTLAAALRAVLARYTGQNDIPLGTAINNRTVAPLENLLGMFANTLVLRTPIAADDSFAMLLAREKTNALSAYEHQHTPFELIVDALGVERSLTRSPVFQVMYVHQGRVSELDRGALLDSPAPTSVDLDLSVLSWQQGDTLSVAFMYSDELFEPALIEQLGRHFERFVAAACAAPDQRLATIGLLDAAESARLLADGGALAPPDLSLHALFEAQVDRTPHALALTFEGMSITYRELDERANRLAHALIAAGARPDGAVAICLERSFEMMVTLFAILKAGAAYLPVDPSTPPRRVESMLESGACTLVIDRAWLETASIAAQPSTRPHVPLTGKHAAYVLFTSGSTGTPKGAVIAHESVRNRLLWTSSLGFTANDVFVQKTPITFDVSVFELFYPLLIGARLVIARPEGHRDPAYIADLIREQHATYCHFVPSMFGPFLEVVGTSPCPSLTRIFCSGEALPMSLVRDAARVTHAAVFNLYGPTEATVEVSCWRADPQSELASVPLGVPIANTRLYVLDQDCQLAPPGVAGELFIAGIQLARGYAGRPDLTAERFVPDPFHAGERMYRTGDLARVLPSGAIEYLGRIDHQIKLRGFRIELGEIEAVLRGSGLVDDAAVLLREDTPGNARLVAYVVASPAPDVAALRSVLLAALPEYMVPSSFLVLDAFPLTSSGKLDRKALPAPDLDVADQYIAPRTPLEEAVAAIWRTLLGVERISVHDDFFALGGHSLLAVRVLTQLRAQLGIDVPVRTIFEAPRLEDFAARLATSTRATRSIVAPPRSARPPLSFTQQRLWFLDQLEPGSDAYILADTRRYEALDVEALRRAFEALIERHEILRTRFPVVGAEPYQHVEPAGPWELDIEDASTVGDAALARVDAERRRPFDLAASPPLRIKLVRVGATAHVLFVTLHHILTDGWSQDVFWRDLHAYYDAFAGHRTPGLSPLPLQYADFAAWQRATLAGTSLANEIGFWTERLRGSPDETPLPLKGPRPAHPSPRAHSLVAQLDGNVGAKLRTVAQREGASLFQALLATFRMLLARVTGQGDLVIGTPVAGRAHRELEDMIGMFVNTLALRGEVVPDETFGALLRRERDGVLAAFEHQDTPFELIVDALQLARRTDVTPLFQVWFVHQNFGRATDDTGTSLPAATHEMSSKFDLAIYSLEDGDGVRVVWNWKSELFDDATMEQLAAEYTALLAAVAASPDASVTELLQGS